jgi:transposase InsO family protein
MTVLESVEAATVAGARRQESCRLLGLDARTVQRWRADSDGADRRTGPKHAPSNKLSRAEEREILQVANSPEFRDLSPKQIVPQLADQGRYVASESSFYRVLRAEDQMAHRGPTRPPVAHRPREHEATGPNQVWSWDITYLRTDVRGIFLYLYLIVDVWSRKIVGWSVHDQELGEHSARLIEAATSEYPAIAHGLILHADNGGPMKASTMLATLQRLGIVPSFSRPHVSDDNPFSESLFRTLKYRPDYPRAGFATLAAARTWVEDFVRWYNTEHLHSAISFVTAASRHTGADEAILARRRNVYEAARRRHPDRWSRNTRNWERIPIVRLNPDKTLTAATEADRHAA